MSKDFRSLEGTLEAVWSTLLTGVEHPDATARIVAFATRALSDGAAVRMVVLRGANRADKTLTFYTNTGSAKVRELESDPNAELLIWDPEAQFQIRLRTHIQISDGPEDLWNTLGAGSRLNYASAPPPGSEIGPGDMADATPDRSAFTVLTAYIDEIETLWLGAGEQRRARFVEDCACWLAP